MSKLSIYADSWINLVFEGRNKEYGAFKLRQKSDETTLLAFCLGLFLVATVISIPMLLNRFNPNDRAQTGETLYNLPIHLSDFKPNKPQTPIKMLLPIAKKQPSTAIHKKVLKDPEVVKPIDADPTIARHNEHPVTPNPNTEGTIGKGSVNPSTPTSQGTLTPTIPTPDNGEATPTFALDKLPEFPGGLDKFRTYIGENFENIDIDETISVIMSFVIEKDGSMTDIKVLRSSTPSIDKEAIRVLKALRTKWKPGIKNGQNVRTLYRLPIKVKK